MGPGVGAQMAAGGEAVGGVADLSEQAGGEERAAGRERPVDLVVGVGGEHLLRKIGQPFGLLAGEGELGEVERVRPAAATVS